ncbi:girdin-like [Gigantopelta aegis]|uniref:girdin-like n=1 Tax=Gigantopelta aegis TaxID=1735272 RepID=UPI001B88C617|nr:girdin-like [Gigantopelta aegis]
MSKGHVRQATFDTAPADSVSGSSIKRGGIEFPVVDSASSRRSKSPQKPPSNKSKLLNRLNRKGETNGLLNGANETKGNGDDSNNDDSYMPKLSNSMSKKIKADESKRRRSPSPLRKRFRNEEKIHPSGHTDNKTVKADAGPRIGVASHIETVPIESGTHVETSPPPRSHFVPSLALAKKIQKEKESHATLKPQIILDHTGQSEKKTSKSKRGHVSPTPSRYEEIPLPSRERQKKVSETRSDIVVPSFKSQGVSKVPLDSESVNVVPDNDSSKTLLENGIEPRSDNYIANNISESPPMQRTQAGRDSMDTFENVRLERDGLIRAENAYKTRIRQLEEEAKGFLKDIDNLSEENRMLRDQPSNYSSVRATRTSSENRDLLERNRNLEIENQSVWTENQQLKSTNEDYEKKIKTVQKENDSIMKKLKDIESKGAAKQKGLEEETAKIESEMQNLRSANIELEKKVNSLKAENNALNTSFEQKTLENDNLLKTIQSDSNLKDVLKKVQEELTQVQLTNEKIVKEIDELKKKNVNLQKEKSQVEKIIIDKDKQLSEKDELLSEKEKQLNDQTNSHRDKISEKDNEIKITKDSLNKKKVSIVELQQQITSLKNDIQKLKTDNEDLRKIDNDIDELNNKIKSLTDDLGKRTEVNKKLRREKSEFRIEIESLKKELELANSANASETKHLKQLLQKESENTEQLKTTVKDKQGEISRLETQLFEINMKVDSQNEKMREIQREKNDMEVKVSQAAELEISNKNLLEENRRLRQLLVERNIEVTNKKTEKHVLTSRLENLERKQKDSEIKVKQLQGWVSGALDANDNPIVIVTTSPQPRTSNEKSPRSLPLNRKKMQQGILREESNKAASYEDIRQSVPVESPKQSPSLPSITDESLQTTIRPSYYQLYKHRLRLVNDRR